MEERVNQLFVVLLAAVLLVAACAPVIPPGGITTEGGDFVVEAHPDNRRGRPVAAGFVYNRRGLQATHVQLRVEALNAAGAVVASDVRFLDRDINPNDRVYFEVTPPAAGAAYRVTVHYVSWQPGGGGAGGGM
jgi:hypothetical protein